MKRFVLVCLSFAWLGIALAAEPKIETVVDGLTNPCGVAVQPETGVVFVSDSGAGRIIKIVGGKSVDVVIGFAKDVYGKGPKYDIGPLGIAFADRNTLVVGDGGFPDGEEFVRTYDVSGDKPLDFEKDAKSKSGPLAAAGDIKPEGNLYGLALTKDSVFVTCNGDDTKGWVSRVKIEGTKFGALERFIPTKEAVEVDAPVAATISPRGELVIGQMGEVNKPNDSLLTFYNAQSGKKLMNVETKLNDITGLAYHPKTGLLYALDFAWLAHDQGGLFQLNRGVKEGDTPVVPVKVASLEKPTSLAFSADGTLYVTVIGKPGEAETAAKTGKLLKMTLTP